MSLALICVPFQDGYVHEVRHDLESVFWVLYYLLLRRVPSDKEDQTVRDHMHVVFDSYNQDRNGVASGGGKFIALADIATLGGSDLPAVIPSLRDFLKQYALLFHPLYQGDSVDENHKALFREKLNGHDEVIRLFDNLISTATWPAQEDPLIDRIATASLSAKRKHGMDTEAQNPKRLKC
jgi:hypothetical protein